MNKHDEEEKEAEIDRVYQILLDAIPIDAFLENIAIACARLAGAVVWEMSEPDYPELGDQHKDAYLN